MNTASSGSGLVDDIRRHPQGEIRGLTKLVNATSFFTQLEKWRRRNSTRCLRKRARFSLTDLSPRRSQRSQSAKRWVTLHFFATPAPRCSNDAANIAAMLGFENSFAAQLTRSYPRQ